ncbi:MAG: type 4a pilus biogenesis protein PilO [Myxococcales bacterium]|nr:type 4a pilus biogenesis protein PilO [Myxococcales bacterium]
MATAKKNTQLSQPRALGSINPNALVVGAWVVAVLAVGALYYTMFYTPLDENRQMEETRRGTLQTQRRQVEEDLRRYNSDQAELARARQREESLRQVLPSDPDIPGFIRNVNALAEASGLQLSLIRPVEERVEQYYARIPVELKIRGGFLQLARFFHSVSQLPRVINMENIRLRQPTLDPATNEWHLEADVQATTFRSVEGGPRNGAAAPRNQTGRGVTDGARP